MAKADLAEQRTQRRAQAHAATRSSILDAARRVAARDGARELSLRGVAAEAGYAPAALYGYFAGKDDLLLALAADDLTMLARAMRDAVSGQPNDERLSAAATVALAALAESETIAAALTALPSGEAPNEAERLFNGRMIAALKVLSDASGSTVANREGQCDVVLAASA
ncbi:MAG: TetR family transcriptional regulator, partial [Alphaproteobacteria bacterium]|nr:TetR family transcriptional regulator [Alphaproteobacteria bacterium]